MLLESVKRGLGNVLWGDRLVGRRGSRGEMQHTAAIIRSRAAAKERSAVHVRHDIMRWPTE